MLSTKLALRLARRWREAWDAGRPPPSNHDTAWDRVSLRWDIARLIQGRFAFVAGCRFPTATRRLAGNFAYHLAELARSIDTLRDGLTPREPPVVSPVAWLADVRQLEAEFGEVTVKWTERVVRVVTDPIELRGVTLGPFAIDLHLDRLSSARGVYCFDFVALEPNPAAGRDDVVHPHVQGNDLCAGDAAGPVQRALEQGRFIDAFLIIRSVLTTYNPSSPYVPLDQWSGSPCSDCGCRVEDEDSYGCEGCDNDLCERCAGSCAACMSSRCSGCLEDCAICGVGCCSGCLETAREDERICTRCFAPCVDSRRRLPKDELTDDLCPDCTPDEEETDDDDEVVETAQAAN